MRSSLTTLRKLLQFFPNSNRSPRATSRACWSSELAVAIGMDMGFGPCDPCGAVLNSPGILRRHGIAKVGPHRSRSSPDDRPALEAPAPDQPGNSEPLLAE